MDEDRLDVAEVAFNAQIAVKTRIAERANGELNRVAYVAGGEKTSPDEIFRLIQRVVERVKQDLPRSTHEEVDLAGCGNEPVCPSHRNAEIGRNSFVREADEGL